MMSPYEDVPPVTPVTGGSGGDPPKQRKFYIVRNKLDPHNPAETDLDKLTSEERKHEFQRIMQLIYTWPTMDVFPFKISAPLVGLTAALPGLFLNITFRKSLLLAHYGRMASYAATTVIPAATAGMFHIMGVTKDILEQRTPCPICVQVRSAAAQLAAGFVYPIIFTPFVCFTIAGGLKNLYFPRIHKQPKEVFRYALDVFKPIRNRYWALGALQIVVAMGTTYMEQYCYYNKIVPILNGEVVVKKKERITV